MKKILSVLLVISLLLTSTALFTTIAFAEENTTEFAGGDGSVDNPYLISNMTHLSNVYLYPNSNFKMISDIECGLATGRAWKLIGETSDTAFKGVFDGDGHTINGFYFSIDNKNENALASLFGYNSGTICNLTVSNCYFLANISITEEIANRKRLNSYASGLVLYNSGTIYNCVVNNAETKATITSSYDAYKLEEKGWVSPRYAYSGGIVVFNLPQGIIKLCQQNGNIYSKTAARAHKNVGISQEAFSCAGGIATINNGTISECCTSNQCTYQVSASYSTSSAIGYTAYQTYDGAIAAQNNALITNCFSCSNTNSGYYLYNGGDIRLVSSALAGNNVGEILNSFYYNLTEPNVSITGCGYTENCYYCCDISDDGSSGAEYASEEDFANGTVAFYLNGGKSEFSETGAWHQNIDNGETPDLFPVLDSTHGNVYMTKACSEFGNTKPEQETDHSYIYQEAVDPTCTKTGLTEGIYCSICGFVDKKQYIVRATGHSYTEIVEEATCLESGTTTYICHCGDTYTETIPATGHSFSENVILNATCTTDGKKNLTCFCGFETSETIPATGHSHTLETLEATCVVDGIKTYTCHCGDTYTETIPATGHNYTVKTQNATCTEDGLITYTCSCGDSYTETISATGHKYTTIKVQLEPSCTRNGVTRHWCDCGHWYIERPPATGHTPVTDEAVAPTCTETGLTEGSHCNTCGATITAQEIIPANGHSYEEKTVKQATCTADGLKELTCSCGDSYTETISKIAHSFDVWEYVSGNTYKRECTKCDEGIENKSIYLTIKKSSVSITNHSSHTLTATVTDSFTDDIVFTSSNNDVASVDYNGKITAENIGSADITATIRGTSISAVCTVNVTPRQFTIIWVVDGVENVQTVKETAQITRPANPRKDGYKFVGWTPAVPQTMPAYNLTFTAVFEKVYKYYCPYCELGFDIPDEINAHIKIETEKRASITILSPSTTTINYGDRIILHAETGTIPNGAKIVWEVNNNNFSTTSSSDEKTFIISPSSSGKTIVTAKIISDDGRVLCSDEQEMTSKAGFFQKIIAFFKNLFGLTKTIPQIYKGII